MHQHMVLVTPGGIVNDPSTFGALLSHCTSVWLQASAREHLRRAQAQGDLRPMRANPEALQDLECILASRAPFYGKADLCIDTNGLTPGRVLHKLLGQLGDTSLRANV